MSAQVYGLLSHKCQKTGHLARVCRAKPEKAFNQMSRRCLKRSGDAKCVDMAETEMDSETEEMPVYTVGGLVSHPLTVLFKLNEVKTPMEVDTGAAVFNVCTNKEEVASKGTVVMEKPTVRLKTFPDESIAVWGVKQMQVQYEQYHAGNS